MPRWIKQVNGFSCGPIAMLNLEKYAGNKVSYKRDYKKWKRKCNCDPEFGSNVNWDVILSTISNLQVIETIDRASVYDLAKFLRNDCICLVRSSFYIKKKIAYHIFLITEEKDHYFFCVNIYGGHKWLPQKRVDERYFDRIFGLQTPILWALKKSTKPA